MKVFGRITFLIPLLLVMMSGITYAAPGDLDTTFNPPNGFVTYHGGHSDSGRAVALQADGKIVVAGTYNANGTDADVLVLRYNPDGSLDSDFGTGGIATYDSGKNDPGFAVALQTDGKIVIVGDTNNDVRVLRLIGDESGSTPADPSQPQEFQPQYIDLGGSGGG
jgi:uncharacterized delta-60 repeat protein